MTGVNPGRHGIFGFLDRIPQTMETFVPTSTHMAAPTLWEWLSAHGKTVGVVNVPGTYPPRQVKGALIGGFLCPDINKISFPPHMARDLKAMGYRIDIDSWKARESRDDFLVEVNDALDKRFEAAFRLMHSLDWDFFQLHIMETDRVNHFLWKYWKERDRVYGRAFLEFYRRLDRYLGMLVDRIGDGTELVILSDHGFCELKREVYLNRWLVQEGFLMMRNGSDSLKSIHPKSRAYSLFPGRVYVNLKGREATGIVSGEQEYEMTRQSITEALQRLSDPDSGESIVKKVLRREDIYWGPFVDAAPDLVIIPNDGYDLKGNFGKPVLTMRSPVVGMHTDDDAFLYVRDREIHQDDNEFGITDAYGAVLDLMEVHKPDDTESQDLL
jgi:predicted AlkP superfamily phosphohydrolase/phosphomutase